MRTKNTQSEPAPGAEKTAAKERKLQVGQTVVYRPLDDHGQLKKSENNGQYAAIVTAVEGKKATLRVFPADGQPPLHVESVPFSSDAQVKENSWNFLQ